MQQQQQQQVASSNTLFDPTDVISVPTLQAAFCSSFVGGLFVGTLCRQWQSGKMVVSGFWAIYSKAKSSVATWGERGNVYLLYDVKAVRHSCNLITPEMIAGLNWWKRLKMKNIKHQMCLKRYTIDIVHHFPSTWFLVFLVCMGGGKCEHFPAKINIISRLHTSSS